MDKSSKSSKEQAAQSKSQKKRQRKKQTKQEEKATPEIATIKLQETVDIPVKAPSEVKKELNSKQEAQASLYKESLQRIKLIQTLQQPAAAPSSNPKSDEICKVEQSEIKPSPVKMEDADQSREAIKAARQAKKAAKKNKEDKKEKPKPAAPAASELKTKAAPPVKITPVSAGKENKVTPAAAQTPPINQENKVAPVPSQKSSKEAENKASAEQTQKSSKELKEERRLKQEAQRAAKSAAAAQKPQDKEAPAAAVAKTATAVPVKKVVKSGPALSGIARTVAAIKRENPDTTKDEDKIHPAFVQLGAQLQNGVVRGCTAKAVAVMRALALLVHDYTTPEHTEMRRHLAQLVQQHMDYLDGRRANSVSMVQAVRSLRINSLPYGISEIEAKQLLASATEVFLQKLEQDAQSVALNLADKMAPGDTVLVYSFSSLLLSVLTELFSDGQEFQVVVVGSRTHDDGLKMLRSLTEVGISCTYILVNQANFIMPQVQLVLLGAESMLANSSMIGHAGCAQVATVAKAQGIPVYACCETYNFSYESQLSPFYNQNESEPDCIAPSLKKLANLSQCSLLYDVVPERLLTAIITEVSVLPCSSVPVVLHMQSSDTVLKRRIKT